MKRVLLTAAALAAFVFASQATAANYQVMLGEQQPCGFAPCKGISGVPKGTTLDKLLPGTVVINAGDTVTYSSASFHTVSYAPKVPPLLMPDPARGKYKPLNDAAGTPFYFAGLSKFIYNPAAFGPFGPHTVSGVTATSSGALSPAGPKAKPATFTYAYPKTGTYHMFCSIHPGMKGTIVVRAAGAPVPKTPAQVIAQGLAEQSAAWTQAKAAVAASHPPANTVYMGVGNGATVLGYLPQSLTVKAGTTVTFVNKSAPEVHNVVFGPKKYILGLEKTTDLFPTGPNSPNQVAPNLLYGTEAKGQYNYDGKNHGNGYLSTPLTAATPAIPLPHSWKVKFTTLGSYSYFCWIHGPDMSGKVVVTK